VARAALLLVALLVARDMAALGFERFPDPQMIGQAMDLGQSALTQERARFHGAYRIAIGKPPVDYLEIVTPFRRVALASETRLRFGGRLLTQREANEILGPNSGQVDILAELTFHPLNTYIGVPLYDLVLVPAGTTGRIRPREIELVPRHGPRAVGIPLTYPYPSSSPVPAGSQPLLGGTVIAKIDGSLMDERGTYDVVIEESGKELAKGRVDFGGLR
jgi:hypothetical protein